MAALTARKILFPCLCAALMASPFPGDATGQTASVRAERSGITGSAPDSRATAEKKKIMAGPVSATITVLRSASPFPVGGSAFARIELANGGTASTAGTELVLETATAEIRSVTGSKLDISGDENVRVVKTERIAKGKSSVVLVELALQEDAQDKSNALKISLRTIGGEEATARFDWSVRDCAGAYYSEIERVRQGSGAGIEQALEATRERDAERPGRWLFAPRAVSQRKRGKCLKSIRRWSKRRGRYYYTCTQFEDISSANAPSPIPYEGRVYRFATGLVSSRAIDRELAPTRDSGWATTRVSKNLRIFLSQKSHPAICTGATQYFDYFDERMQGFLKRAETYDDMAAKSYALALLRTVEALEASEAAPGGHPGWGASPLVPVSGQPEISLKKMVEMLAHMTGDPAIGEKAANEPTAFAGLMALLQYMKNTKDKAPDTATHNALRRALGAVEAADYIARVGGHYANLRHALAGSIKSLRQAHVSNCKCSG